MICHTDILKSSQSELKLLNVLLLSQFFSTTKGGGEYVFKMIAQVLIQNGHKVWVITNNVREEDYEESENLKIIRVEPTLEFKGGLPPTFYENVKYAINAFKKGREIIKKERIDLVHSNNFSPAIAGSLISLFTKTPHITTIHDIFSGYEKDFWKKWARQSNVSNINARLVPLFEKILMKLKFECIHTVSETTKNDIEKIGIKKPIYIIPNCIKEDNLVVKEIKTKQFLYLGRLVFYKNVEIILNAFKIVKQEFPDVKLIIAGDGPHRAHLEDLTKNLEINENTNFLGYVRPEQKIKLLAESNALLFPSTIEGFGLVMLESLQQKRPVIVSNVPPMSEIITNNETGLLIDPYNEKEWANAIIQFIKNPQKSLKMGENGYQIIREKYSQKQFFEKLKKMYEDILNKHPLIRNV